MFVFGVFGGGGGEQCGYESVMEFLVKGVEGFDHHRERMRHLQFQKDKFKEVFEGARRAGKPVLVIIDTLEDDHFAKNTLANDDIMEIAVG